MKPTVFNYQEYEAQKAKIADLEAENEKLREQVANLQIRCRIAEAARETGKWEGGDIPNECSECGAYWDDYVYGQEIWYTGELPNFCPNCGACMIEEGKR